MSYNSHFVKNTLAEIMQDDQSLRLLTRQLELIKEAGFKPPLIAAAQADISARVKLNEKEGSELFKRNIEASRKFLDLIEKVLGHRDVYYWGRGEPSKAGLIEQFPGFKALHEVGVKIGQEAQPWHLQTAAFTEDLINLGGDHYDRTITASWHALGQRVLSYASPHPGAENPDLARRRHGMMLYKCGYDGHQEQHLGLRTADVAGFLESLWLPHHDDLPDPRTGWSTPWPGRVSAKESTISATRPS